MTDHETYIKRCLFIAKLGLGKTRPNPMVGCVIVYKNEIIGEGFTSPYGGNHAEVNAIKSVRDKSKLKSSTLYVTLEPCSHYGKTPPCSDLIVENKIPNVVIGCLDVNEKVAGKGVAKLKESGCNVIVGILEKECKNHHKRFFTFHIRKRPYIILKWAETLDGFIAPESKSERKPIWITNELSRQLVHKWRTEEQAILVGKNTVIQDNPSLTARDWTGENPVRIVLDPDESLSKNLNVFNNEAKTFVICEKDIDYSNKVAEQISDFLFKKNINSVIIEGGSQTLQTFLNSNLWDEARVFIGQKEFKKGIKAPEFKGTLLSEHILNFDILKIYNND